jgi:hypothetical protein
VEQELLSLIELQSSLPLFSVVPVTQSLVTELQNWKCHVTSVGDISLNHKTKDGETDTTQKMGGNSGAL